MSILYLLALLASLGGMILLDRFGRLAFWRAPRRSAISLVIAVLFFLAWDAAGITAGIFLRGDSPIATGILLAPEMPLEEPLFLVFLVYLTMNLLGAAARLGERRR